MTTALTPRLDTERRLLAALFLFPQLVDLEPRHFAAPAHAALFGALDEVQRHYPVGATKPHARYTYDDIALALVVLTLKRDKFLDLFSCVGGVEAFLIDDLARVAVTAEAIPDLVDQVRSCPTCRR